MTAGHGRGLLSAFYWAFVVYLALPLGLIALMSFKQGSIVGFPLASVTGSWYAAVLSDQETLRAFAYSAGVALASSVLAVLIGTWTALAIAGVRQRWLRLGLRGAALIPLVTPGIVHAIALRIFIRFIGLDPGLLAVLLGHAVHAAPYAVLMVGARLATAPPNLVEAARDLGAGPVGSFRRVTLPWLRPALLGAALLAVLTSVDDFIRSFFLGGYQATLPVLIYGRLRSGLTPELNAIATLVLLTTAVVVLLAERQARRARAS